MTTIPKVFHSFVSGIWTVMTFGPQLQFCPKPGNCKITTPLRYKTTINLHWLSR